MRVGKQELCNRFQDYDVTVSEDPGVTGLDALEILAIGMANAGMPPN